MKKTLVALAALAATGAFAQVTVTGKLGFSVQKTADITTTAASQGMRVTDGDVVFTATEDLGGGYKATASQAVLLRGRDTAVSGRDATITLTTPVGALYAGAVESGPLLANAYAGAPMSFATGADSVVLDGYNNIDVVGFKAPLGSVTVGVAHLELNSGLGSNVASTLGNSALAAPAGISPINGNQISVGYAAGALAIDADYTVFSANTNMVGGMLYDGHARTRVAGTYDMGVAKVGLGFQSKNHDVAGQYAFGISAPLGALTVGLTYSARNKQDVSAAYGLAAADARSGTTVALRYDLSKTTNIYAGYGVYSGMGAADTSGTDKYDNEYRIRLLKSF
jgi:hypothetical protein